MAEPPLRSCEPALETPLPAPQRVPFQVSSRMTPGHQARSLGACRLAAAGQPPSRQPCQQPLLCGQPCRHSAPAVTPVRSVQPHSTLASAPVPPLPLPPASRRALTPAAPAAPPSTPLRCEQPCSPSSAVTPAAPAAPPAPPAAPAAAPGCRGCAPGRSGTTQTPPPPLPAGSAARARTPSAAAAVAMAAPRHRRWPEVKEGMVGQAMSPCPEADGSAPPRDRQHCMPSPAG